MEQTVKQKCNLAEPFMMIYWIANIMQEWKTYQLFPQLSFDIKGFKHSQSSIHPKWFRHFEWSQEHVAVVL